jgi:AcrR family transcriptional regulator
MSTLPRNRRSDAAGNRERLLEAARDAVRERGFDVPLREVAERAGVGTATLYRHFATKEELVTAAFAERLAECRAIVDAGAADPDPWRGLVGVVERLFELHAREHMLVAELLSTYPRAFDRVGRRESVTVLAGLLARAKAAGAVRADVHVEDVVLVLRANDGLRGGTSQERLAASRRFAALAVRSLAA